MRSSYVQELSSVYYDAQSDTDEFSEKLLLLEKEGGGCSISDPVIIRNVSNNEVLDRYGYGRYQYVMALCCALARTAALSHIFLGTAVVSSQNVFWKLSVLEDRMVYTVLAAFCIVGGICAGKLADLYGRKRILLLGTMLSGVAMIIGSITPHYYLFIVCNVLAGIAIGASLVSSTCLYSECIPNKHRSYAVTILIGFTCLTNLVICLFTYFCFYDSGWRWHYGLIAFPNLLSFFLAFFWTNESPRYYGLIGHTEGQMYVLARIRNWNKTYMTSTMEDGLISSVVTDRGSWKGLLFRFFGATLATMATGFMVTAVISMITFSSPIMIVVDYCDLGTKLHLNQAKLYAQSDHFEYLLLAAVYLGLATGTAIAHNALENKTSRTTSIYILLVMLIISIIPQMQCITTYFMLASALFTVIVVGALHHIQTLLIMEMFPTYIRGAAFGVVHVATFLGMLYGPYVDILMRAGSLKSVYAVFFVLSATTAVLVKGVEGYQYNKIYDSKDDVICLLESDEFSDEEMNS